MNGGGAEHPRRVLWTIVVFAVGLATRLFFVVYAPGHHGDSPQYTAIARHIVEQGAFAIVDGSPTVFRPPGYPFFMAAVYAFFGPSNPSVLVAQAILGAAACALLYRLLLRLVSGPAAAVTAVMTAAHTDLAYYAGSILSETLLSAALVAFVYCVYRANDAAAPSRVRLRFAAASGVAAACVVLVHPRFIAAPLIGMAALWLAGRDRREPWKMAAVCSVTAFLVLAPWTVRNYLEFRLLNPTGLCDPSRVLLLGAKQVPPNDYRYLALFRTDPLLRRYDEFLSDWPHEQARFPERLALERELATEALRLIASRPGSFLLSVVRAHPHLWISRDSYAALFTGPLAFANQQMSIVELLKSGRPFAALLRAIAWAKDLVLPLVLVPIGMVVLIGRWRHHAVLYLLVAWVAIVQAPLWIEYRFTVPLHPILAIFAAHALDRITPRPAA